MNTNISAKEEDTSANITTIQTNGSFLNDKIMSELVELLYENMKDETEHIDMISRGSLIELAESNLAIVLKIGIEAQKNIMKETLNNPSSTSYDIMVRYMNLFKEIIERHCCKIDKTTYQIIATFVSDAMQSMISNSANTKDIEKNKLFEKQTILASKLLIYVADAYFLDVLTDLMNMFTPGNVPHRNVIELLTELALVYPVNASSTFQDVVSLTLPILANIQNEEMRVVFSKLFAQICESVTITIDNKAILNFQYENLSQLLSTVYDFISAKWIKDIKSFSSKIQIINALIIMSALLPENSMRNNLDDIVNMFINNLKKENTKENALISKSFRIFFEATVTKYKERMDAYVQNLLVTICSILTNVNISPNVKDFSEDFIPLKAELLKISFLLFRHYHDRTFEHLIGRFDSISLLEKLSNAYLVKTMLIRSEKPIPQGNSDMLISAISKASHEPDHEFKYSMFELIYVMFEKDMIHSDGRVKMILFLVTEAGYTDEEILIKDSNAPKSYPFYTNYKIIRDKAEDILLDIVNKIPDSENYLWPGILEYMCDYKYEGCNFILSKMISCIKAVIDSKMEMQKFKILFVNANLPNPGEILIKLFILLSHPNKRQQLTDVSIPCLKILTPLLSPDLEHFTPDTIELEHYLRICKYLDYGIYNDMLLTIWEKYLNQIKSLEFLSFLITSILENISKYNQDFIAVGFLMKMQGLVLSYFNQSETLINNLDTLFNIAHCEYKNEVINGNVYQSQPCKEIQTGVGEAFGLCAKTTNLDIVLDKIDAIFKSDIQCKKTTAIASFFSSAISELSPYIAATLITALGSIAKYADASLLASRLNANFLSHIDLYFNDEKTIQLLKHACIVSLGRIFKALHKLSSFYIDNGDIFILQSRDSYLEALIKIFKAEKEINDVKIAALESIGHLIRLDPPVFLEQSNNFIFLSFSVLDCIKNEGAGDDEDHERALDAMNSVLESILIHESHFTSTEEKVPVDVVMVKFEYLLNYDKEILTSWDFFSLILEKFAEKYLKKDLVQMLIAERVNIFVNSKKSFKFSKEEFPNWVASLLCIMVFFFDDSNPHLQTCFLSLSRLLTGYEVNFTAGNHEGIIEDLVNAFKVKCSKEDYLFIFVKLNYLLKIDIPSVNKSASILLEKMLVASPNYFVTDEKSESYKNERLIIEDIVESLVKTLEFLAKDDGFVSSERYLNVLKITEELAKINLTPFIDQCMKEEYGLPLPVSLTTIIQRLCKEKSLITKSFTRITDIINNGDPGFENSSNYMVCASTLILGLMLETHGSVITPLIKKFFPQLLSTLLLRIGSCHSINYTAEAFKAKEADPRNQTLWALQQLMFYFDEPELSTYLEAGGSIASKLLNTYEYDEGIYELMNIFCKKIDYNKQVTMFEFLSGFLDRPWNGQRVVVISCYAAFVGFASVVYIKNTDANISEWRNNLITELLKSATDSDELARKQSIRGLANLCRVRDSDSIDAHIVNLLVEKLSDSSDSVVLESINALQLIMDFLPIQALTPYMANLLVKLRPCFDIHDHAIRSLGFSLFNSIISFVPALHLNENSLTDNNMKIDTTTEEIIKEHIHLHLVSLLLHSNDENTDVRNNCLKALLNGLNRILGEDVAKVMDDAKSKYMHYDRIYEEFIKTLACTLTAKFPTKIPFHISNCIEHSLSSQDSIRATSVHLLGMLYHSLALSKSDDILNLINLENVFCNFSKLLKDFSVKVRVRTTKTLILFKHVKANSSSSNLIF